MRRRGSGTVPILVWNAQHEWVTFRHVGGQPVPARAGGVGPLVFLGGQFGVLLGFWFVVLAAAWRSRPWIETDADRQFLWWMSVPTLAVFLLLSLKTTGQLNWAVTAYISGSTSAAWLAERIVQRSWRSATLATAILGLSLILAVHYPALSRPVLLSIVGRRPHSIRCRFAAWIRRHACAAIGHSPPPSMDFVRRHRDRRRGAHCRGYVLECAWIARRTMGKSIREVYSLGSAMYDRRSQLDFGGPTLFGIPNNFVDGHLFWSAISRPTLLPLSTGSPAARHDSLLGGRSAHRSLVCLHRIRLSRLRTNQDLLRNKKY